MGPKGDRGDPGLPGYGVKVKSWLSVCSVVHLSPRHHKDVTVTESMLCVQGEKGEPGLVIGPDGNLLHLDGLRGQKVSLAAAGWLCLRLLPGVICSVDFLLLKLIFLHRLVGRPRTCWTCWSLCKCLRRSSKIHQNGFEFKAHIFSSSFSYLTLSSISWFIAAGSVWTSWIKRWNWNAWTTCKSLCVLCWYILLFCVSITENSDHFTFHTFYCRGSFVINGAPL